MAPITVNLFFFKLTGTFEKTDISAPDGGTKNHGHRLEDGAEGERRGVVSLGVQEQKQVNSLLHVYTFPCFFEQL